MAVAVKMPQQGMSLETHLLAKWHKEIGEEVKAGELLFTYETEKTSFEEVAPIDGVLLATFYAEFDDVPVLTNVAVIGQEGEAIEGFNDAPQENLEDQGSQLEECKDHVIDLHPVAESEEPSTPVLNTDTSIRISPRAKKLAERLNLDYRYAVPTGPKGRIIEQDILDLKASGPVYTHASYGQQDGRTGPGSGLGGRITTMDLEQEAESLLKREDTYEVIKHTGIRRAIAKNMMASLQNSAQLTLTSSFNVTQLQMYRQFIKENHKALGLSDISINDMIAFAVSKTLLDFKEMNAHYDESEMRLFNQVHLGMAVDTERGLMVPTIFNASSMTLKELSQNIKKAASDCRENTIEPERLSGGTFTISNLGALGVEVFTPVLNPPQVGLLGVGAIDYKAMPKEDGFDIYPAMTLSLTFDHRALDGAPAARFLKAVCTFLENFTQMAAMI